MAFVGEQRMWNTRIGASVGETSEFSLVPAMEGNLRSAVDAVSVSFGIFGIAVDAFVEGRGVRVSGLGRKFAGRHFEIASYDGIHNQVRVAFFCVCRVILGKRANPCGRASSSSFLSCITHGRASSMMARLEASFNGSTTVGNVKGRPEGRPRILSGLPYGGQWLADREIMGTTFVPGVAALRWPMAWRMSPLDMGLPKR